MPGTIVLDTYSYLVFAKSLAKNYDLALTNKIQKVLDYMAINNFEPLEVE